MLPLRCPSTVGRTSRRGPEYHPSGWTHLAAKLIPSSDRGKAAGAGGSTLDWRFGCVVSWTCAKGRSHARGFRPWQGRNRSVGRGNHCNGRRCPSLHRYGACQHDQGKQIRGPTAAAQHRNSWKPGEPDGAPRTVWLPQLRMGIVPIDGRRPPIIRPTT